MSTQVPPNEFALFLDVDGTLIDIAPHPDEVIVPEGLVRDLERAERVFRGAVALISGRTIGMLDALFTPLRLRSSGVHGAEFRFKPNGDIVTGPRPLAHGLWTDLQALTTTFPGTMIENKTYSYAIHYRSVPGVGEVLGAALSALIETRPDAGLRIMPGHFVFEIKASGFDKGVAIDRFMAEEEFLGRRPIFIGDDVTDWPGFAASLRAGGLAYAVGPTAVDVTGTFADPSAVRSWLRDITL